MELTSKEALNNIRDYNTETIHDVGSEYSENPLEEECNIIEKDLEVLEIFKKELVIEVEYNYLTEKYDVFIYGERGFGEKTKLVIDKDKGDLLKEWLENDK